MQTNFKNGEWLAERAIISPTNLDAEEINNYCLNLLPGKIEEFKSVDSTEENSPDYTPEFLNTINAPGIAQHKLNLKLGAPVVLLRNIDPKNGHCNGVKYIINNMRKHIIELKSISQGNFGSFLFLPRILMVSQTATLPFTLKRRQFPIRLAFGITSNRSQGETLQKVGLYCAQDFFTHGQVNHYL